MKTSESWNNLKPSYIREILQVTQQRKMISLAGGLPSTELLPVDLIQRHLSEVCTPAAFQYGNSQGAPELIESLQRYHQLAEDQSILVTGGSQQGLDLIARTFLDQDAGVVMESPCYLGALQVFQLSGCNIHSVEQNSEGPDIQQLETLFRNKADIRFFYAVPDFHNPTGRCWSDSTRQAVARLCRQYGICLIEDAPYRSLRFYGEDKITMQALLPDLTLQLNSFSKTLSPGIRLGYIVGPEAMISKVVRLKQAADLHTALPFQQVVARLIHSAEYRIHLDQLIARYSLNYNILSRCIDKELKETANFEKVEGGMFLWLRLNDKNASSLAKGALQKGLAVVPGIHFYHENSRDDELRLNFSHSSPAELEQAIDILKQCICSK